MPELPEVETVCRGLSNNLLGKRIVRFEQHRGDLRTALPERLAERLVGQKVLRIERRAKYIQIFLDDGQVLLLHLGMSGRMIITPEAVQAQKHDHLVFHFEGGMCVLFNDPRRFGCCDLVSAEELPRHKWLQHLGIEPLGGALTGRWLQQVFKGRHVAVKTALMDQRLVVGVGNIYASEALFHAGIDPQKQAGACSAAQLNRLAPAVTKVLQAAIAAGGSSLRDYRQANGELGYFQHHFAVYDREGQACPGCRCDVAQSGRIRRITQGGRSTYYCATCQT